MDHTNNKLTCNCTHQAINNLPFNTLPRQYTGPVPRVLTLTDVYFPYHSHCDSLPSILKDLIYSF